MSDHTSVKPMDRRISRRRELVEAEKALQRAIQKHAEAAGARAYWKGVVAELRAEEAARQ